MSKNPLITIVTAFFLVTTVAFAVEINVPVAHAADVDNTNPTLATAWNGFHFPSIRSFFQDKIQASKNEIQAGKKNAAKNRNERNTMLAAQTIATSTDTTQTDTVSTLTVSWTSLTNIASWMEATTTAAGQNGADISGIQPLLDSAQRELDVASSSINIITSSSTALGVATSSLELAKTDLEQALELLKTIVNN